MSRSEYVRKAESLAQRAARWPESTDAPVLAATAQVYATLALTTATAEGTPQDITVYRASHESIVMDLYTSREAARQHCETLVRSEVGDTVFLGWVPDNGDDDAPEELCTGEDVECTGYVVTPLTVASAYDEEADE